MNGLFPRVIVCADGSLCCNDDEQCCAKGNGVFIDNDGRLADIAPETTYSYGPDRTVSGYRTNTHSTSTTSVTSETTSAAAETTSASNDKSNDGDDDGDSGDDGQGLKIGLGVGIPVAALLVAALVGFFFWRRRRASKKNMENQPAEFDGTGVVPQTHQPMNQVGEYYKPQEPAYGPAAELDSGGQHSMQASELDSSWSGRPASGYDSRTHASMSPSNPSAYHSP